MICIHTLVKESSLSLLTTGMSSGSLHYLLIIASRTRHRPMFSPIADIQILPEKKVYMRKAKEKEDCI